MTQAETPFWLVERYLNGRLHYWTARGNGGRGDREGWTTDLAFATKLADPESATQVLFGACNGDGRAVQHLTVARAECRA